MLPRLTKVIHRLLRHSITLLRRLAIPFYCLNAVLRYSTSFIIAKT